MYNWTSESRRCVFAGTCSSVHLTILALCIGCVSSFDVIAQEIVVLAPIGGERYTAGETCSIHWHAADDVGTIDLLLWDASKGNSRLIASDLPARKGAYEWLIPTQLNGERFRLRVDAADITGQYGISANFFAILPGEETNRSLGKGQEHIADLSIWPSPARHVLHVSTKRNIALSYVSIRDLVGKERIVQSPNGAAKFTLPLARLSNGLYLAECRFADGLKVVRKIIIHR